MNKTEFIKAFTNAEGKKATTEQIESIRKQAEQAKQENNQDFANLLERIADALEHGTTIEQAISILLAFGQD